MRIVHLSDFHYSGLGLFQRKVYGIPTIQLEGRESIMKGVKVIQLLFMS